MNLSDQSATFNLTRREIEIIRFISEGLCTKQIAELLYISRYTVEKHRSNILRKTSSNNFAQLVRNNIRFLDK